MPGSSMWTGQAAKILAAAGVVMLVARLLFVSRFDVNTAATILATAGVGNALVGTAVALLPFALVVLLCAASVLRYLDPTLVDVGEPLSGLLFWGSVAAVVVLVPLAMTVIAALFILAVALLGRRLRRRPLIVDIRAEFRSSALLRVQLGILIALLVFAPIVVQRPWFPLEALVSSSGTAEVGYLLGEQAGQQAILRQSDRSIVLLPVDGITMQYVCRQPAPKQGVGKLLPQVTLRRASIVGLLLWGGRGPDYPACPRARS